VGKSIVDWFTAFIASPSTTTGLAVIPSFADFAYSTDSSDNTYTDSFWKWTPGAILDPTGVWYGEFPIWKWSLTGLITA